MRRGSAVLRAAAALLLLLAAVWGGAARADEAEDQAALLDAPGKEGYEARKAAFKVRHTPPGETPRPSEEALALAGDLSARGLPARGRHPKLWFPVGEIAEYEIAWGVFTVGSAWARADWVEIQGRRFILLTMEAESNGIVEALYPVEECMQTLIDPNGFLPIYFEKQSKEGRHKTHDLTTFDHARGKGTWRSFLRRNPEEFDIGPETRDLMGLMYWIRQAPVEEGETREYEVMTDERLYTLTLEAEKKRETLKVGSYGKVPCLKMEPKGKFNGMFIRTGRMFVWISEDPRCTLCRATARVPVASIKIILTRIRGPGDDFWVAGEDG